MSYKDTLTAMATISQMEGGPSKAGERLAEFAQRLMGATKQEKKALKQAGLSFFDKGGHLKDFPTIVRELQNLQQSAKFQALTQQQQLQLWKEIFQGRGEYTAFALAKKGDNSFQAIQHEAETSLDIHAKLDIATQDLNQNMRALTGTIQTAIADGFAPILPSLTNLVKGLNDATMAADEFAKAHPKGMKIAEEVGGAGLGVGFLLSTWKIFKGLRHGLRGLKSLAGFTGMGMDMIEGKAAAAVTRAMPVFVVGAAPGVFREGIGMPRIGSTAAAVAETAAGAGAVEIAGMSAAAAGALGTGVVAGLGAASWFMKESVTEKYQKTGYLPPSPMEPPGMTNYGDYDAELIAEAVKKVKPEVENNVTLNINVPQSGPVTVSSNDPHTTAAINLKRGKFLEDLGHTHY